MTKFISLTTKDQTQAAEIDISQCYSEELKLEKVTRKVLLREKQLVVVEDTITGENISEISYFWHGHPDTAWWIEDGWARIYLEEKTLWIGSPQVEIRESDLQRLRGSRGQLTLMPKVLLAPSSSLLIRWFFLISEVHPAENDLFRQFR